MSRNLVVCLDGTNNEPEKGTTNVARMYEVSAKDGEQLVYYDPGVGTMGARSAITPFGRTLTRVDGLVLGYGIRENLEEAYRFLMQEYRRGDRVFLFGFSRGAYTARALAGLLRTVGLLRSGADNLIPYALKLYTGAGRIDGAKDRAAEQAFWEHCAQFARNFGSPEFPDRFDHRQVEFLGVWDTVKSVGWLNWKAQLVEARWPFSRQAPNTHLVRHAMAIDEHRRPFPEYRVTGARDADHVREVWFAGVHSDVGGQFPDDHRLSDIALAWMVDEAVAAGLHADPKAYRRLLDAELGTPLPDDRALGRIHPNGRAWDLLGRHVRRFETGDEVHPSVRYRIDALRGTDHPYTPPLPSDGTTG